MRTLTTRHAQINLLYDSYPLSPVERECEFKNVKMCVGVGVWMSVCKKWICALFTVH